MKVLMASTSKQFGGIERYLLELGSMLTKDIECVFVSSIENDYTKALRDRGFRCYITEMTGLSRKREHKNFLKIVNMEQPDIIHSHGFRMALRTRLIRRYIPKSKTLSTIHGQISPPGATKRVVMTQNILNLATQGFDDRILVVSHDIKQQLIRRGINSAKLAVVYCGIDTSRFNVSNRKHQNTDKLVVGTVARLASEKRIDILLLAMSLIVKKYPQIVCKIIGDGPERENLEMFSKTLGLENNVYFLGMHADVRPFLQELDIFILTSKTEGLPISILEAMASGVPVVASGVGGVPEIITHGQNGLITKPNDIDDVVSGVCSLIENRDTRESFSKSARAMIERKFSLERSAEKTICIYRSLLGIDSFQKGETFHD